MQAFFSVLPAQAGMILLSQQCQCGGLRTPRASGDDPIAKEYENLNEWYSPRKRG